MSLRRSLPAWLFVLVFTLIQGVAPLLHAHVQATAGPGTGVHMPDGVAVIDHEHPAGSAATLLHAPCGLDEGALVTAATEHRRDDAGLPPLETPALVRTVLVPHPAAMPMSAAPASRPARYTDRDTARPFSTGPPAIA
ncbi:MAG: hypothetical protein U1F52_07190 [Burkholderiales bacterium]